MPPRRDVNHTDKLYVGAQGDRKRKPSFSKYGQFVNLGSGKPSPATSYLDVPEDEWNQRMKMWEKKKARLSGTGWGNSFRRTTSSPVEWKKPWRNVLAQRSNQELYDPGDVDSSSGEANIVESYRSVGSSCEILPGPNSRLEDEEKEFEELLEPLKRESSKMELTDTSDEYIDDADDSAHLKASTEAPLKFVRTVLSPIPSESESSRYSSDAHVSNKAEDMEQVYSNFSQSLSLESIKQNDVLSPQKPTTTNYEQNERRESMIQQNNAEQQEVSNNGIANQTLEESPENKAKVTTEEVPTHQAEVLRNEVDVGNSHQPFRSENRKIEECDRKCSVVDEANKMKIDNISFKHADATRDNLDRKEVLIKVKALLKELKDVVKTNGHQQKKGVNSAESTKKQLIASKKNNKDYTKADRTLYDSKHHSSLSKERMLGAIYSSPETEFFGTRKKPQVHPIFWRLNVARKKAVDDGLAVDSLTEPSEFRFKCRSPSDVSLFFSDESVDALRTRHNSGVWYNEFRHPRNSSEVVLQSDLIYADRFREVIIDRSGCLFECTCQSKKPSSKSRVRHYGSSWRNASKC